MKSLLCGGFVALAVALASGQADAAPLSADPLVAIACPLPPVENLNFANTAPIPATPSSGATVEDAPTAPTTSPRLDTLAILRVGLSVDVYRQGQLWAQLQQQNANQAAALKVGSILPMDPKDYPTNADDKDMAWEQRKANALELALQGFPEHWPIPTLTVVRGYNPQAERLRVPPEMTSRSLNNMAGLMLGDAGLHWHEIKQMQRGVICNDTPEGTVETLFQVFEHNPDMPAVLVYVVEGVNMAGSLTTKDVKLKSLGAGSGPRRPGVLTDAIVALVVGRPERLDWLSYYAPHTKVAPNPIDPMFTGWARPPRAPFTPSPSFPRPITVRGFQQWDAMQALAVLHRPVTVSLGHPAKPGTRLRNDALTEALAAGWRKATDGLVPPPARLFFDSGKPGTPLAELMPALKAANSPLDLLQSNESYDLTQRLGDTGAASPFVGIALAAMASYTHADTSVVMPLRRGDQATLIAITSATPGKKPATDPFGVRLMPQTASSDQPSTIIQAQLAQQRQADAGQPYLRPVDPDRIDREQRMLDDFLASGPGVDLDKE